MTRALPADPNLVSETEHGLVRLFTTELDPPEASKITPANVQRLLGDGIQLDPSRVEVVPSKALEGLGLRRYLVDGYGIAEAELAGKAAALDALTGLIVLVPSSAFRKRPQVLDPNPAFRFIGVFREDAAEAPSVMAPRESAEGMLSPPARARRDAPGRRRSWVGALGALVIALALVIWLVL